MTTDDPTVRTATVTTEIHRRRASSERRPMTWHRAAWYGVGAFVISRLCVLAGAGVRAAQLVVDAEDAG